MKNFLCILFVLAVFAATGQENTEIFINTQSNGNFKLFHKQGLRIFLVEQFNNDSVKISLQKKNSIDEIIIFDGVISSPISGYAKVIDVPKIKNVSAIIIQLNNFPKVYVAVMSSRHYLCISKYESNEPEKSIEIRYQKYPPDFY